MITRRQFIYGSASIAATIPLGVSLFQSLLLETAEYSIFSFSQQPKLQYGVAAPSKLVVWRREANVFAEMLAPFYVHSFLPIPGRPDHFLGLAKWSRESLILNLKDASIERLFPAKEEHLFHGHGLFSQDGQFLFTSEQNERTHSGEVVVRDSNNFNVIRSFSSNGLHPHQSLWTSSPDELVIANFGAMNEKVDSSAPSNLSWIDVRSGKVNREQILPGIEFASHLCGDSEGWLLASGASVRGPGAQKSPGMVWSLSPNGEFRALAVPSALSDQFKGEMASILIDETKGHVIASGAWSSVVLVWDYKKGVLIKSLVFDGPHAIFWGPRRKFFYVVDEFARAIFQIEPNQYSVKNRFPIAGGWGGLAPHPGFSA